MTKVEAVVIGERVETVIDAVEEATGHVGVTVIEAIGHGRERGPAGSTSTSTVCGATPSSFIPVPGGYGTESHGHLGSHAPAHAHAMSAAAPATAMEPTV